MPKTKEFIYKHITENPFTTMGEICKLINSSLYVKLSSKTVAKFIKQLKFSKKKAYHHNIQAFDYDSKTIESLKSCFAFSIDECYFSERILPNHGYCLKGQRLHTTLQPKGWKKRYLLLMVCNDGTFQYQIFKESVNAIKFVEF